jgi:hypothetical protein
MNQKLSFVTCASDPSVLNRYLLSSPCLMAREYNQTVYQYAPSAAAAFNREMARQRQAAWLVWVHQDVFLPQGWDSRFIAALTEAERCFSGLAVVGVYGVTGAGDEAQRAGHLLDRGILLKEPTPLPCRVDSVDELLFAVRTDSGLQLDPNLGFDFYGTDLALTAKAQGFEVAVVDAYCEHWSTTPLEKPSLAMLMRIKASGRLFEQKWVHRLPIETPCFSIFECGDIDRQCQCVEATDP